ncbi:MAG: hypothetical protein RBG13Loki_4181 [Promethearchaeota archaeon CR_4]|nr:MAG: hypothetical protein RBG13Loki_4181 [Candidatus Lokiarchaeota archaeon CR_4]
MCLALVRYSLGKKGFTTPGWTPEEYSLRRVNSQSLEKFGVTEREFHHFPDFLDLIIETSNVLVCDKGDACLGFFRWGFVNV